MTITAITLLALHLIDGASTLYGTAHGLLERNAVARWALASWWRYAGYITPKADGSIVDSLGNGNALTTSGDSLYGASGGPGLPWWPV